MCLDFCLYVVVLGWAHLSVLLSPLSLRKSSLSWSIIKLGGKSITQHLCKTAVSVYIKLLQLLMSPLLCLAIKVWQNMIGLKHLTPAYSILFLYHSQESVTEYRDFLSIFVTLLSAVLQYSSLMRSTESLMSKWSLNVKIT